MSYKVLWPDRAMQSLGEAYLAARAHGDADAITQVMSWLEREVARDPTRIGESRLGNCRVVVELPLVLEFEVFEDEKSVVISNVRYVSSHR